MPAPAKHFGGRELLPGRGESGCNVSWPMRFCDCNVVLSASIMMQHISHPTPFLFKKYYHKFPRLGVL